MDYRDNAVIIFEQEVSDGLGGFITKEVGNKDIKCKVAPFTILEKDNKGRTISYSLNKLFTKTRVVDDLDKDFKIKYKDKLYNKVSIADYGKCYMIVMERDG